MTKDNGAIPGPEQAPVDPTSRGAADWEAVSGEVLGAITADVEHFLKVATDNVYERLLYTVQDYLTDNVAFNIGSRLDAADAQSFRLRRENDQLLATNLNLYTALNRLVKMASFEAGAVNPGQPFWDALAQGRKVLSSLAGQDAARPEQTDGKSLGTTPKTPILGELSNEEVTYFTRPLGEE